MKGWEGEGGPGKSWGDGMRVNIMKTHCIKLPKNHKIVY